MTGQAVKEVTTCEGGAGARPPVKKPGQATGRRAVNGAILDIASAGAFLGVSGKMLRARVARRTVPFRRLGGRIVFLKSELEKFLESLDGVNLYQALGNLRERAGGSADDAAPSGPPLVIPQARP